MDKSDEEKDVYLFKAPSAESDAAASDETGAIVGAVAACIIISAVLLFLWKMLQRKKTEMEEVQKANEKLQNIDIDLPCSSRTYTAKQKTINEPFSKTTKREKIQLPNSTVKTDPAFDSVDIESQAEDVVLPPISPVPSLSWSQQEMISSDTGYNSGFARKDGALRRRYKQCSDELYMEHPRDIVEALKRDQQLLRIERQKRTAKIKGAMQMLKECRNVIQSAKEKLSVYTSEKMEALQSLQRSRRKRNYSEMKRNRWKYWGSEQQKNFDEKEAFLSMQEWFDGLRLHISTRQVAEEVFLLRSLHRTAIERNEFEKQIVIETQSSIRNCIKDVAKTKEGIRSWKRAMDGIEPERAKCCENLASTKVETISHEATDASSKHRIMFPRVLKKNVVRPSPITETIQENVQNVIGNMCQQCNRTRCQCSAKAKEKVLISTQTCLVDPFVHFATKTKNGSEPLNSTEISDLVHDVQTGTSKAQPTTFETYLLTLTLRQVLIPGNTPSKEANCQISEREIQKVLQRVPSITALKSMRKDSNGYIVEVESITNRVANIRFNCKGKSYIIGMLT